jgi:hypothetical protein
MSRLVVPAEHGSPHVSVVRLRDVVPWAILAGAVVVALLFVVGADQGIASVVSGERVHEFLHDARHLLGVPCH